MAVLGTPEQDDLPYRVEDKTMQYIKSLPKRAKLNWTDLFSNANPLAIDLLSKMLIYNPSKR